MWYDFRQFLSIIAAVLGTMGCVLFTLCSLWVPFSTGIFDSFLEKVGTSVICFAAAFLCYSVACVGFRFLRG